MIARGSFHTRLFITLAGGACFLALAMLVVVDQGVTRSVEQNEVQGLEHTRNAFNSIQERYENELLQQAQLVSDLPYFRAAIETYDPEADSVLQEAGIATIQDVATRVLGRLEADLLVLTDSSGRALVEVTSEHVEGAMTTDAGSDEEAAANLKDHAQLKTAPRMNRKSPLRDIALEALEVEAATSILHLGDGMMYVAAVPLGGSHGAFGALILAQQLDQALLNSLEDMTGSAVALVTYHDIVGYSKGVPEDLAGDISKLAGVGDYHRLIVPLSQDSESAYVVLRSKERALGFLSGIRTGAIFITILAMIVGSLVAYFLSRQLTTPIKRLADHTELLAGGDLDSKVHINSNDELSVLAEAFNRMGDNLRDSRRQLMQAGKMAALGEIGAGLAHELKQPLASIRGFSQLMQRDVAAGKMPSEKHATIVMETVDHMVEIVQGLKDFSRKPDFVKKEVDLNTVIERTATLMQAQLTAHSISLEVQAGENLPTVMGDANQLQQVFTNLIANARDALRDSKGHIRVSTRMWEGREFILASVTDDGPGIPEDVLPNIFQSFFTTKQEGEGTGLGLSLTQGIVHDHGGRIEVRSQPGKGTVFRVFLPTAVQKPSQSETDETRRAA